RSARIVNRVLPGAGAYRGRVYPNLHMLVPFGFLDWSTVDLEMNTVVPQIHPGNDRPIAGLDRRSPQRQLPSQRIAAGRNRPILQDEPGLAHGKFGADE